MDTDLDYRKKAKELFEKWENKFLNHDPDEIEANLTQGSLVFVLKQKNKVILSMQPPLKQIWLAVAHKGIALHFDWDAGSQAWIDDKTKSIELENYLSNLFSLVAKA